MTEHLQAALRLSLASLYIKIISKAQFLRSTLTYYVELDFSVAEQGQHKRSRLTWRGFKYARCGKPNGTVWNRLKNKRGRFIEKTGENQTQTRCVIWCLYFSHNISVFGLP